MRARRERGGVGKGARGVVQFRVGITLDFRGDVATSPALSLLPLPLFLSVALPTSSSFSPPPLAASSPASPSPPPRAAVSCVLPFQRRPPTPRTTGKEHPPRLSGRDRSFRARYPIYRPRYEHIASDDISPSLVFGPDATWPMVSLMEKNRHYVTPKHSLLLGRHWNNKKKLSTHASLGFRSILGERKKFRIWH